MNRFLLFITLLFLPLFCFGGKWQKRFSILGLGDSITEGGKNFTSYLFPLWEKLMAGGYEFDFVGPNKSSCRIGTLDNCGFSGKTVEYLDEHIDSLYRIYPADIVLLHAGHNHFAEEKPVKRMIEAYRSIIRKIHAINPEAKILMAQVIESGKLPKYGYIPDLNDAIRIMVDELNDGRVILVNQANGFDWRTMTISDKVHPNGVGAEMMASTWYDALKRILKEPSVVYNPTVFGYKAVDGRDSLKLHVFFPEERKTEKRPAIVYFFGGGWTNGTPFQFYRECAYYASKGFVAISADYRIRSVDRTTPYDSFEDAKDVIRWIGHHSEMFGIDAERIIVAGASAGGQLAAALGTSYTKNNEKHVPYAMLLYYPVLDTGIGSFAYDRFGKWYKDVSPIDNVTHSTPPALLLVGGKDEICTLSTAQKFSEKMKSLGKKCELHIFENAGHPIFSYRSPLTKTFYDVRQLTDNFLEKLKLGD